MKIAVLELLVEMGLFWACRKNQFLWTEAQQARLRRAGLLDDRTVLSPRGRRLAGRMYRLADMPKSLLRG